MAEEFFAPRVNVIESTEGFSVEMLGRTGLRYMEGERALFIDSEILSGRAGIAAYQGSIVAWQPPHDSEALEAAEKDRIIANVRRAFSSQGQGLQVIG
jgi:hypothetical protein